MPGRAYWPDSSVEAVNALSWSNTASAITDSLSGLKQQVDQLTTATLPPLPSLPSLDDLTQRWFPSSDQAPQSQSDQAAGGSFATVPDTAPGPLQRALKPLQDLTAGWGSSATPAAAVYPDAGGVVQTRQPAPSGAATSTPAEMPTAQPAIEQPASSAPAAPAALPDRLDTSSREANLRQWAPALQDVERRTGLRADSMAAIIQAENGGGQSPLSANDNNYFSITAVPGRPNQAGVGQGGRFAHYNSPQDSLNDFVDLIQKHYPEAWANRSDPQKFFAGLVKGGYIVPEPGFPVETWLTNLETGRQHFNQLAPAAAPPPANIPGPDLSPNGTPITAPSQERPRGPYSGTYTQQSLANAGDPDAWSKCGPVAALQASALLGGNLDPATVERLAKQRGWTASAGMAGLQSEAGLLNDMNIAAKAEQGPVDWQRVIADVQRGNPVILQLPGHEGHYVTAQAYDPQTGRIDFGSTVGDLRAAKHQTKFTPQELEGLGWGSPNGALWIDNPATPAPSVVAGNSGTSSITPPRPDASDAAASVTAPTAASMTDRMATTLGQPTMYRQPLQPTAGPDTFPTDQQPPATQAIPNEDPTATPRPAYVPPAMPLVLQNDDSGSNVSPVSSNPDTSTVAPPPSPYDQQQAASMEPPPASGQALPDRFSTPSESPLKPVWDAGGTVIGYVHAGLDAVDRSINAPVAPPGSPQARALQTVGINPDALPAGGPFGAAERTVRDLPAHLASLPAANQQAVTETADAIVQSARATGQDIQQGNVLAAVGDGLMTGLNAANALYAPLARDVDHLLPDFGVGPLGAGDIALNTSVPHDVVNLATSAGRLVANGIKATPKVLAALRNGVSVDDILQRAAGAIDTGIGAARAGAERAAAIEAERAGSGATAYGTLGSLPPAEGPRPSQTPSAAWQAAKSRLDAVSQRLDDATQAAQDAERSGTDAEVMAANRAYSSVRAEYDAAVDDLQAARRAQQAQSAAIEQAGYGRPYEQADTLPSELEARGGTAGQVVPRTVDDAVRGTSGRLNATAGTTPDVAGPDRLAGVNRALGQGAASAVSGGVGAATNQQLNPDDPNAALKGFAVGAVAPYAISRGARALAGRAAGRAEGALATLGHVQLGGEVRAPTIGAETTAFGANPGERVQFRFRVVPLEDLITSHTNSLGINPDFPRELQPRIRDRAASGQQINSIMQRFDPGQMLVDTHTVDRGPMIVGPDNVVESGNGRSIALRRLAQEKPAEYRRYVDELRGSLPDYGLTPTALEGIDHPVLVRERASDVNRAEFAAGANVSAAAEMAPIERAMQDAGRLDDEHVTRLTVGDGQSIDQALLSPDNRDVVRAFVGAVPESERGALLDASGNLNAYGLERLKSALLAKTYTGEAGARIATAFVESTDPGVRNVENAVYASLPAVARSEALVASGERDASLSVAPDVATAIDVYARLKRAGMSVGDYLAQGALFGDRETTPVQDQILQYMNDNARSPRRIRDMLEGYAQAVDQQVSPDQVGMFGEASRATKEEVLNGITRELGAAPADTGADVGRVGAGGEELARAIQGPSAVPEPSTGAPALSAADESRQRFERAQAAAQGPVSQPRTPASEIIPATGGPEGRLAQEGAPAPPGVAPRRFTAPAEALAASHGAIGEPNPTSPSAGTSRLEVVRRWIVRQATDNMVDLAELQKDAQRALGRPLTAEEMITEQTRVNPAGASKVTIDERIKPVLQGLDDSRPVVTLPAGQALTQRSALTQAMVLANNRDVAVALNTPTRVFSGGLTGADSEAALQHLISNMAPKDQRAVAGGMRELNGVVETYRQKLVDAGVWSQDFADEMRQRYPNWVPTKILDYMADADKSGGVGTRSISMRDRGVRQYTLEGTLKSREDPIASLIRYVDESEARIQKNEVFQGFANLYDALKANPESGWANLVKEVPNSATAAAGRGERTVQGFINGERRTFIASPAVSAAVRMEQGTQIPIIRDVTRLFRELITRTPVFVAGQIPLDAMAAIVRTSNLEGGPQYAPKVAAEIVKGYATAFSGLLSNEFKGDAARYMREGGAMAGFYQRGIDAASHTVDSLTRRSMFEIKDAGDAANLAKWLAGGGWVQAVGQRVELGPRIAAFRMGEQRALRAGADPATAALQGVMAGRNSTMDFQVGGAAAKVINQAVPFFNVGVQSSVTLARIARENPKAFPFTMAALVAAPTVAAEAWNRSDPQRAQDYADVPEYIKDRGIVFMLPGVTGKDEQGNPKPNFAIIPLRELAPVAILTRELAASAMRSAGMEGQDSPRGWGALLGAAASSASPVQANSAADLFSSMNPVGINTGLQLATNRDYFRNRDIATERNDQQASALARGAASAINAVTGSQIRPSQTDFAIRDLTGGAGAAASAASDLVAGRTKDEQRIQSTPVVGGIVRRFVGDTTGGQLEKARDTRISERARGIVNETGLRDDQLTPVGTTIENVPLLQREQTAYQARTNRYFEQEIVKARGAAAWRTNPQDRQQMVRDALSTAKERAATDVMQAIPPAERQRRVGQAARQKAS
jgi:flagellum-specific peptidoglycan hydrolase FlgJ